MYYLVYYVSIQSDVQTLQGEYRCKYRDNKSSLLRIYRNLLGTANLGIPNGTTLSKGLLLSSWRRCISARAM